MSINTEKIKTIIGIEEMKNYKVLLRQLFAEFLGTFIYLALISLSFRPMLNATLTYALSNGLAVGSVIQIIGHVSGGHINPAVTFGVLVTEQIRVLRALCYIVAQVLGAITGSVLQTLVENTDEEEHLQDYQVFFLELFMSFTLVLVVLSVVDTNRGGRGLGSAPLAIGLCLAVCQCSCQIYIPIMNPAAAFGSAILLNTWTNLWAYCLGPILGGICAGLIYRFVFTFELRSLSSD